MYATCVLASGTLKFSAIPNAVCKPCCDQHDEIKAFVCTSKHFKMTLGLPLNILNHQLVWPWDMQNGEGLL